MTYNAHDQELMTRYTERSLDILFNCVSTINVWPDHTCNKNVYKTLSVFHSLHATATRSQVPNWQLWNHSLE